MPISTGSYTDNVKPEEEKIVDELIALRDRYKTGDSDLEQLKLDREGGLKQGVMSAGHGIQEGTNAILNLPTDLMGFKQWADIDYVKPREGAVNEFISTGFQFATGLPAGGPVAATGFKLVQKGVQAGMKGKKVAKASKIRDSKWDKYKQAAKEGMIPAAGADFVAFSGNESLIYNLMQMHPELQDAYGTITGKDGWDKMTPSELADATQGLGTFDSGRMIRNWGGRGLNVAEGAVAGALLQVFWRAVKLQFNNDKMTKASWEGKDEAIKKGVEATEKRHGKVLSDQLSEKEKQEHLAFRFGPMVDRPNLTPEQAAQLTKEEAELAAAQADLADKVDASKGKMKFEDMEEDDLLAPQVLSEADERNAANELGIEDILGEKAYDYSVDEKGMVREGDDPVIGRFRDTDGDTTMFLWERDYPVEADYDPLDPMQSQRSVEGSAKAPILGVNEQAIADSWNNPIPKSTAKRVYQPSVRGEGGRLYAQDAFNSYEDFESFLIARQMAKRKFPKLAKESVKGYEARLDRAAADAMKRRGIGNFWKYEFDALKGMEQFKVEEETILQAIFKDPAQGKQLAEEILKARSGAGVDLNKAFIRAMEMINIENTMSDAGQKYMTARVMQYFMKTLRRGFNLSDNQADPLGNQFAKAIGWHGDPNRMAAKDHLHDHLLNNLEEIATATGLSSQGVAERIRKGYGDFKHLFDETSIDDALGQDVAVMREMYIRTWAYKLDQVITVKQLERAAESINKTEGKASVQQLAEFATVMERLMSKLGSFRNLKRAEGRALAANKAFQWAKDEGLGGGQADQLMNEIMNRTGGHAGLMDLAAKVGAIADANKNNPTHAGATAGLVTKSVSGIDIHNEYWINSVLSGARTQIVNTIGTALHMVWKPLEGMAGAIGGDEPTRKFFRKQLMFAASMTLDTFRVLSKLGLNKIKKSSRLQDEAAYSANRKKIFEEGGHGAGAVAGGRKALRHGKATLESRSELFDLQPASSIRGELLAENAEQWAKDMIDGIGNIIRIPSRLMITTDELFKQIQFRSASMAKLYNEAVEKLPKEMQNQENIQKYMADRFQGLIRGNGARFTPDIVKDEAYRAYTAAVTRAERDGTPLEAEYQDKQAFIQNYIQDNYVSKAESHGEVSDFAMDWAEDTTFTRELDADLTRLQDMGKLEFDSRGRKRTSISKDIQNFASQHSWMRVVTPFIRTPMNLLKFPLQRLPILHNVALSKNTKFLDSLHQRYQADMMSNDPIRVAEAKGRMRVGALMYGTLGGLAASGMVTGAGSRDPQQRQLDFSTGWRPYSFRFGDTYISYARLDPFSTIIGLVADTAEFIKTAGEHGDIDEGWAESLISAGLYSAANNLSNKAYLTGMTNWLNLLTDPVDGSHAKALIQKQATSYVPKALSQLTVLTDDNYIKQTYTLMEAMQHQIPFLAGKLEAKRNILGDKMEKVAPDIASRIFSIFNPFLSSKYKHDNVLDTLAGLNYNFGAPEPKLQGKRDLDMRKFRDENGRSAYDFYTEAVGKVTLRGKTLRETLESYFGSKKFASMTKVDEDIGYELVNDDPRINDIKYWLRKYRGLAKKLTLKAYPDLKLAQSSFNKVRDQLMNVHKIGRI